MTVAATETSHEQLTQEILRVTGIIKVNFPVLYASIYDTPSFISFEEERMEYERYEHYLEFLQGQLNLHRGAYTGN